MWSAKQLQLQGDPSLLRPPPSAFGAPLAPTWELLQVRERMFIIVIIIIKLTQSIIEATTQTNKEK